MTGIQSAGEAIRSPIPDIFTTMALESMKVLALTKRAITT